MTERWIQGAIRHPGALRRWLSTNASRPPWGLRGWTAPKSDERIDPSLVRRLVSDFERLKEQQGGLNTYQQRAYRRLVLARTLKDMRATEPLRSLTTPAARVAISPFSAVLTIAPSASPAASVFDSLPSGVAGVAQPSESARASEQPQRTGKLDPNRRPETGPPTWKRMLDIARRGVEPMKTGGSPVDLPLPGGSSTDSALHPSESRNFLGIPRFAWGAAIGGGAGVVLSRILKRRRIQLPVVGSWQHWLLPILAAWGVAAVVNWRGCRVMVAAHPEWGGSVTCSLLRGFLLRSASTTVGALTASKVSPPPNLEEAGW